MALYHDCRVDSHRIEFPNIPESVQLDNGCLMESITVSRIHDNRYYKDLEWYVTISDNVLHFINTDKEGEICIGYKVFGAC